MPGVLERTGDLRLADKPEHVCRARLALLAHDLDGHVPSKGSVSGGEDGARAALDNGFTEIVAALAQKTFRELLENRGRQTGALKLQAGIADQDLAANVTGVISAAGKPSTKVPFALSMSSMKSSSSLATVSRACRAETEGSSMTISFFFSCPRM
jgi:hypothetical protein